MTNRIRWVIDNLLPPLVSDSRWFNRVVAHVMFSGRPFDLDFKEKVLAMSPEELRAYFNAQMGDWTPYRESDTTERQRAFVLESLVGSNVLEVGCGNGLLAVAMARTGAAVTACDFMDAWVTRSAEEASQEGLSVRFAIADAEALPWEADSFDTVVSTHTLEHIPVLRRSLAEMVRVARRRLVIVVPRQKYKRYTIDTHVNFFPTEAVLRWSLGLDGAVCREIDGDWAVLWDKSPT